MDMPVAPIFVPEEAGCTAPRGRPANTEADFDGIPGLRVGPLPSRAHPEAPWAEESFACDWMQA